MKLSTALKVELQNTIASIDARVEQLGRDRAAVLHLLNGETPGPGPRPRTPLARQAARAVEKVPKPEKRKTPKGQTVGIVLDVVTNCGAGGVKPSEVIRAAQHANPAMSRTAVYSAICTLKKQGKIEIDDSRNLVAI